VAEVVCPRCGHRNPLGSNFCSSCGAALAQHPDDTATLNFVPGPGDTGDVPIAVDVAEITDPGLLVVTRGPNVGARVPLTGPRLTAGRHPDSDLFLDDVTVSRRHAEIVHVAEGYEVRDVGSLNGTYVNRERVDHAILHNGDELQIGKFKLAFFAKAADAP
jgi:pSer/pThr/pTyr-binding forkhead associated (FHA) protein